MHGRKEKQIVGAEEKWVVDAMTSAKSLRKNGETEQKKGEKRAIQLFSPPRSEFPSRSTRCRECEP